MKVWWLKLLLLAWLPDPWAVLRGVVLWVQGLRGWQRLRGGSAACASLPGPIPCSLFPGTSTWGERRCAGPGGAQLPQAF